MKVVEYRMKEIKQQIEAGTLHQTKEAHWDAQFRVDDVRN